jgi:hypothetical protein
VCPLYRSGGVNTVVTILGLSVVGLIAALLAALKQLDLLKTYGAKWYAPFLVTQGLIINPLFAWLMSASIAQQIPSLHGWVLYVVYGVLFFGYTLYNIHWHLKKFDVKPHYDQ